MSTGSSTKPEYARCGACVQVHGQCTVVVFESCHRCGEPIYCEEAITLRADGSAVHRHCAHQERNLTSVAHPRDIFTYQEREADWADFEARR